MPVAYVRSILDGKGAYRGLCGFSRHSFQGSRNSHDVQLFIEKSEVSRGLRSLVVHAAYQCAINPPPTRSSIDNYPLYVRKVLTMSEN